MLINLGFFAIPSQVDPGISKVYKLHWISLAGWFFPPLVSRRFSKKHWRHCFRQHTKKTREVPWWLDVFGDVSLKKHLALTPSGKVMTAELCSHDPHVGILALESLN